MDSKELFGDAMESVSGEPVIETPVQEMYQEEISQTEDPGFASGQIQDKVEQESKKGNNGLAVVIVTLLFILVIGLCVYIAVSVSDILPKDGQEDKEYEAQTADPWEEILGDDYKGSDAGDELGNADSTVEYPNYSKDFFTGPYYDNVVDCIDESVSYGVNREFQNLVDEENNIDIHTSFIQIDGGVPGTEEINRILKEEATYFVNNYEENKEDINDVLEEAGAGIHAEIKSYVTYNTESVLSVVIREDISMGFMYSDVKLRCYNINLDTGTVLENTSILELEDFGQEFRERSNKQNGVSESGMEVFTNDEIETMLTDDTSLIIFYTPLGMEVGYNYQKDGVIGWITITMQDYEEYLKRM